MSWLITVVELGIVLHNNENIPLKWLKPSNWVISFRYNRVCYNYYDCLLFYRSIVQAWEAAFVDQT